MTLSDKRCTSCGSPIITSTRLTAAGPEHYAMCDFGESDGVATHAQAERDRAASCDELLDGPTIEMDVADFHELGLQQ